MKKKIALALLMVLLFAVAVIIVVKENTPAAPETEVQAAQTSGGVAETETVSGAEEEMTPEMIERMDYDALYAAFAPETVIGSMNGSDVSWEEYYGWLSYNIAQMESTMDTYRMYYGMKFNWSDDNGTGETFTDMMKDYAGDNLIGDRLIDSQMNERNLELSEESLAAIEAGRQEDKTYCCGEGASDEEFAQYLRGIHISDDVYDYMSTLQEYQKILIEDMFGSDLEKLDAESVNNYIVDNGYMNVNHILQLTQDMGTGEALSDKEKAEKLAKAEELLAELQTITDPEELTARFRELKDEYCEDTGKISNPDGYVFTKGTMVQEFEAAAEELEDYGLSGIVESTYGYHILLRLPMNGDTLIDAGGTGEKITIKEAAAQEKFIEYLEEKANGFALEYSEDFIKLDLADYIVLKEA